MMQHVRARLESRWRKLAEDMGRCGVNSRRGERAKGGGEVEGHWRGANSHLMALLITVKVLEESSAKNEGPQYVWVLKGIKNVSK